MDTKTLVRRSIQAFIDGRLTPRELRERLRPLLPNEAAVERAIHTLGIV